MQQLSRSKALRHKPGIRRTLATLAAGLLSASAARAADAPAPQANPADLFYVSRTDEPPSTGSRIDGSVLFYQETGRVRAIEPALSTSINLGDEHYLSLGVVSDSVTGATPNGAVPSNRVQNFLTPIKVTGSTVTTTSASGGSTIVQLPPTPGQVAAAALGRQYSAAPNTLPVDGGFNDQRFAGNIGWAQPVTDTMKMTAGAAYSSEHDYTSGTVNASLAQDFNGRNTTASLAVNAEFDRSSPFGGTPTPLTSMNAQWKGPGQSRTILDFVGGLTEVVNRYWLAQLNYSYGTSNGYNTDPYRIISVVDASGQPIDNIYENRPRDRTRESVYFGNKVYLGSNVVDASFRYFWDSWGIKSETLEVSDRYAVNDLLYVEPQVRWYHQTAASFYHYYLNSSSPLPTYASSDTRLGTFTGMTYGSKIGLAVGNQTEINLLGLYYRQSGNGHPAGAPGQLAQQNLFPGVTAISVIAGFSVGF